MIKTLQHLRSLVEFLIIIASIGIVIWGVPRYGNEVCIFVLDAIGL
jgi:hypothetical protein